MHRQDRQVSSNVAMIKRLKGPDGRVSAGSSPKSGPSSPDSSPEDEKGQFIPQSRPRKPSFDSCRSPINLQDPNYEFKLGWKKKEPVFAKGRVAFLVSMEHTGGRKGFDEQQTGERLKFAIDEFIKRGIEFDIIYADDIQKYNYTEAEAAEMGRRFVTKNRNTLNQVRAYGGKVLSWDEYKSQHLRDFETQLQTIKRHSQPGSSFYKAMRLTYEQITKNRPDLNWENSLALMQEEAAEVISLKKDYRHLFYPGYFPALAYEIEAIRDLIFPGDKNSKEYFGNDFVVIGKVTAERIVKKTKTMGLSSQKPLMPAAHVLASFAPMVMNERDVKEEVLEGSRAPSDTTTSDTTSTASGDDRSSLPSSGSSSATSTPPGTPPKEEVISPVRGPVPPGLILDQLPQFAAVRGLTAFDRGVLFGYLIMQNASTSNVIAALAASSAGLANVVASSPALTPGGSSPSTGDSSPLPSLSPPISSRTPSQSSSGSRGGGTTRSVTIASSSSSTISAGMNISPPPAGARRSPRPPSPALAITGVSSAFYGSSTMASNTSGSSVSSESLSQSGSGAITRSRSRSGSPERG